MKISGKGIELIKKYEGLRLTAYHLSGEKYHTIGYGHYGPDVKPAMRITKKQAEDLLRSDLVKFERSVSSIYKGATQSQFDALVSFTYNCGAANLKKLVKDRNPAQIADAMLLYNKAGGRVLSGLTRRRKEERSLFLTDTSYKENIKKLQSFMNGLGANPKLATDGIIGAKSKAAFQSLFGEVII